MLGRFGIYDIHKFNMNDILALGLLTGDVLAQENELMSVGGLTIICDLTGSSFSHIAALTPTIAKKTAVFMQVCSYVRASANN